MNKKMKRMKVILGFMIALLAVTSCGSSKEFVYLQDMHMGERYPFEMRHEALIHRDDRLSITVSCKQPQLAIPFNVQNGAVSVSSDGEVSVNGNGMQEKGYRVDYQGNINFPLLGSLHLEGLTINQATTLIRDRIIEGDYIKDPLVSIDFLNFHYTVLGAVGGNGTYTVEGDRVTLLEAIAKAGDLAPNAKVDRVAVIREVGDERQIFYHDLRTRDVFSSPCFYLQQNDIVYVEPKYRKKEKSDKVWQYVTGVFSLATAAASVVIAIKN